MPDWFVLILAPFAIYRAVDLFVVDDGPWGVFFKLRQWVGVYKTDDTGEPVTVAGQIFHCPHCLGVYVALLVAVQLLYKTTVGDFLLIVLGLAGIQSILAYFTR